MRDETVKAIIQIKEVEITRATVTRSKTKNQKR
jgi:hypothetical protein